MALLLYTSDNSRDEVGLISGVVLLLLAIPLLLPWLVERVVVRWSPNRPSLQLAVRRLQLDSGTPARVVGGVAVVLAGAITMQTMLLVAEDRTGDSGWASRQPNPDNTSLISANLSGPAAERADAIAEQLRSVNGVAATEVTRETTVEIEDTGNGGKGNSGTGNSGTGNGGDESSDESGGDGSNFITVLAGSCRALAEQGPIGDCRDGDVFYLVGESGSTPDGQQAAPVVPEPGTRLRFVDWHNGTAIRRSEWTMPANARRVDPPPGQNGSATLVLATPAALAGLTFTPYNVDIDVTMTGLRADAVEDVRNALAPLGWQASAYVERGPELTDDQQIYLAVRGALLAGSLLTLLVASASLLVLALEQVRERRRPLAVLAASGVPRRTLALSLLWQNSVPALVAVVLAVASGMGLGALLLRILSEPVSFDWAGIGLFSAATGVAVLVVTALTLPSLRRATTAEGLRAE